MARPDTPSLKSPPAMLFDIASRALRIVFLPEREWQAIAGAGRSAAPWLYAAVLALIPPFAGVVAGYSSESYIPASGYTPYADDSAIASALSGAARPFDIPISTLASQATRWWTVFALGYAGTWATLLLASLVLAVVAPFFDGRRDFRAAFEVVTYASTPVLVATLTLLHVALTPILAFAIFHACYLCYLGLPALRLVPRSEAGVCIGIAVIVSLIGSQVVGYVAGALSAMLFGA